MCVCVLIFYLFNDVGRQFATDCVVFNRGINCCISLIDIVNTSYETKIFDFWISEIYFYIIQKKKM